MRSKPIAVALALSLLPVGVACARSASCAPADPSLAGHYWMHGVMEVGSELLLKGDGRF